VLLGAAVPVPALGLRLRLRLRLGVGAFRLEFGDFLVSALGVFLFFAVLLAVLLAVFWVAAVAFRRVGVWVPSRFLRFSSAVLASVSPLWVSVRGVRVRVRVRVGVLRILLRVWVVFLGLEEEVGAAIVLGVVGGVGVAVVTELVCFLSLFVFCFFFTDSVACSAVFVAVSVSVSVLVSVRMWCWS